MNALGRTLRRWRVLRAVKQSHAADLLGVDQPTISRWERGGALSLAERQRVERLLAASLDADADRALARLVRHSPGRVHLICDLTHRLLAMSAARPAEFSGADLHGRTLLPFATDAILAAEARLADMGWYDSPSPADIVIDTGRNRSRSVPIGPSLCRWTRMTLSDGTAVRLVETIG